MAWRSGPVALGLLLFSVACGAPEAREAQDVLVRVDHVGLDPRQSPVVVLEEADGERWLPIWIGTAEARSIALQIEERVSPRPNTHDLARDVIRGLEGEVVRVVVTDLREGTYYATLAVSVNGRVVEIDSRPSDGIAIALRTGAPIYVRGSLFQSSSPSDSDDASDDAGDELSI
jgi:bifunctional DNase/RNase